jgi:MYXO-CTERM domain-containing protein
MLGLAALPRHVRAESAPLPPEPDKVDLVIVIDEATLTEAVRTRLVQALPQFFDDVRLGANDRSLHVAVLGTNMGTGTFDTCAPGTGGVFQATPQGACSGPEGNFFADEIDYYGQVTTNYPGELADAVACVLPAGGEGCAFSQPMAALQAALDGSVSENDGFLRSDAVLAILVVTGADDCSASDPALFDPAAVDTLGPLTPFRCFEHGVTCDRVIDRQAGTYEGCAPRSDSAYLRDPQDLVTFLRNLKERPTKVVVGVLADPRTELQGSAAPVEVGLDGDGNPQVLSTCGDASASAAPVTRLAWLAEQFTQRSTAASLCEDQFGAALSEFDTIIDRALYDNPPPPPPPPPPPGSGPDASPGAVDAGEGDPGDAKGCGGCSARPDDSAGNAASLLLGLALLAYLVRRRPA